MWPLQRRLGCISMKEAFWLSQRTPVPWFSKCSSQAGRTPLFRVVPGNADLLQQETLGWGQADLNDAPEDVPGAPEPRSSTQKSSRPSLEVSAGAC